MKNKISVIITVLNGENTITSCLESVKWADEIVVVDDGSTDNTLTIAKKYTDKIFPHKSQGFVEPSRNFAIEKASNDWILILDADEQVPSTLASKLQDHVVNGAISSCVRIPRKNMIFKKWIQNTGWWPDYNIRFFKKGSVVWSNVIHSQPKISGPILDLGPQEEYAIIHQNYVSVSQFLQKLDRYTSVTANERIIAKESFSWHKLFSAPFQEFLSRYFARKGYKDGLHGLVLSILMAFYEFTIYLKMWEKEGFTEVDEKEVTKSLGNIYKSQKQLEYWIYNKKIEETSSKLKKNILRTKRKLRV